jgi:hypothetical protein
MPQPLEMSDAKTTILFPARSELEEISERMRRNCEAAVEIIRNIDLDDLSPESRECLCGQIHTLREMVRILSPNFEKKLMLETEKLGRGLSSYEVRCLLYGITRALAYGLPVTDL